MIVITGNIFTACRKEIYFYNLINKHVYIRHVSRSHTIIFIQGDSESRFTRGVFVMNNENKNNNNLRQCQS